MSDFRIEFSLQFYTSCILMYFIYTVLIFCFTLRGAYKIMNKIIFQILAHLVAFPKSASFINYNSDSSRSANVQRLFSCYVGRCSLRGRIGRLSIIREAELAWIGSGARCSACRRVKCSRDNCDDF